MDAIKSVIQAIAALVALALVAYNIYTGAVVQSIGIPGIFEISFRNPTPSSPTTTPPPPPGITPSVDGNNSSEPPSNIGSTLSCTVMIANSLVTLMKEPDRFGQQLVQVQPGQYPVLDSKTVIFAGKNQGWYQIEASGRRGWIADDTWTISSKSRACQ
jgi:hypothetical protein